MNFEFPWTEGNIQKGGFSTCSGAFEAQSITDKPTNFFLYAFFYDLERY